MIDRVRFETANDLVVMLQMQGMHLSWYWIAVYCYHYTVYCFVTLGFCAFQALCGNAAIVNADQVHLVLLDFLVGKKEI